MGWLFIGLLFMGTVAMPTPDVRVWTQHVGPVLTATQSWEQATVVEPAVIREDGIYRMWYRGGWTHCQLGYAASPDGVNWAKLDHPLLGHGIGGERYEVCCPTVIRVGDTYYVFYLSSTPGNGALRYATSPDGVNWTAQGVALDGGQWDTMIANTAVWVEGQTWHMIYESMTPDGVWRIATAVGTGPASWTKTDQVLNDLSIGGSFGGPSISGNAMIGYTLYYHASATGVLPTEIYRSTSPDLINWTTPEHIIARAQNFEVDQVADPEVMGAMMWFDGDDNITNWASIGLAVLRKSRPR